MHLPNGPVIIILNYYINGKPWLCAHIYESSLLQKTSPFMTSLHMNDMAKIKFPIVKTWDPPFPSIDKPFGMGKDTNASKSSINKGIQQMDRDL